MIKRRIYFIDRKFQGNFILKFCVIVVIASAIIAAVLLSMAGSATTVAIENTKVSVKNTFDFLLPIILVAVIAGTLFSALAVGILSVFVSHKISGPLYRIKKEIERIRLGDLTANFRIRKRDQLQELANSLNEMSASLQDKVRQLKESSIKEEIAKVKELLDYFQI